MPRSRIVVVVDDDKDFREALREALRSWGYAVIEMPEGGCALAYLRSHPAPDLILLDWNMAPMDGGQFMAELTKDPALASIPVVLLTADRMTEQKAKHGFVSYLVKPVRAETLFAAMEHYCPE
jgi:CheY-like chemotaxis protein